MKRQPTNLAGVTYEPPKVVAPTRDEGGMHDDYRETHPAYGIIGASRTQSTGAVLFGSDFRHRGYITVRIQHAAMARSLHSDRFQTTGEPTIVEVTLSEAQWATFISTLNMGEGVPCTIERIDGVRVPDIEPVRETRRDELNTEIRQTLQDLDDRLAALQEQAPTKKMKFDIGIVRDHLRQNTPFVAEQFDRHATKTIERMKTDVEAYLTGAVMRAGLSALGAPPPVELIEPGPVDADTYADQDSWPDGMEQEVRDR
jgi:hypothetical protein